MPLTAENPQLRRGTSLQTSNSCRLFLGGGRSRSPKVFQKQKSPEQNTVYSETEKLAEGGGVLGSCFAGASGESEHIFARNERGLSYGTNL